MAEAQDIPVKVGDIVMLRSGGPPMTIYETDPMSGSVACVWIDHLGQPHTFRFGSRLLQVVTGAAIVLEGESTGPVVSK